MKTVRLTNKTLSKEYTLTLRELEPHRRGWSLYRRWGPIGGPFTEKVEGFLSEEGATNAFNDLLAQKKRRGYVEDAPPKPKPSPSKLKAKLKAAAPDALPRSSFLKEDEADEQYKSIASRRRGGASW